MKGNIVGISQVPGKITFNVDFGLGRDVTAREAMQSNLRVIGGSVVQFDVIERPDTDEDDDSTTTIVPFQIAYAVSIHKAQGLEFDSVKVVITEANEENISHSIFYTAITRARKHLEVYWTRKLRIASLVDWKFAKTRRTRTCLGGVAEWFPSPGCPSGRRRVKDRNCLKRVPVGTLAFPRSTATAPSVPGPSPLSLPRWASATGE